MHINNICLSTGVFPSSCKPAIVLHLIEKPGLDIHVGLLYNYRPASNV